VLLTLLNACNTGADDNTPGDLVLGTVSQGLVQQDIQIKNYTKATLPTAGNPGRLGKLTDDTRDLWVDVGTQWVSLTGEIINAKAFGAIGDNTNDTVALNAAIAAAIAAPNKTLYLPPGTYLVNSPLVVSSSITIVGAGMSATTIKYASGITVCNSPTVLIEPTSSDVDNVSVHDLTIDGNRAGVSGANCGGSTDSGSSGLEVRTVGSHAVNNVSLFNLHITNTNGDGISLRTAASDNLGTTTHVPTNILVANNFIDNWLVIPGTAARNGVAIVDGSNVSVSNNRLTATNGANAMIDIEPCANPQLCPNEAVTDVTISGNVGTDTVSGIGIAIVDVQNVIPVTRIAVTGNVMTVPSGGTSFLVQPNATNVVQSGNSWSGTSPVDLENVRTIVTKSIADSACTSRGLGGTAAFTPRTYAGRTGTSICQNHIGGSKVCTSVDEVVVRTDNSEFTPGTDLGCNAPVQSPWPYGGMYITQPDTNGSEWNNGTVYVVCCQ
jgi:hypothetical protein